MDLIANIASALANNLFSQVAVLIGLIALIGLLLQRKPLEQVVGGAVRATLGVVILNIGVDIFVAGLVAFQAIVSSAFRITPPTSTSNMATFLAGRGTVVPLVIAFGFLIHLVLVALFKSARYVYLTGHLMYWMSLVLLDAAADVDGTTHETCRRRRQLRSRAHHVLLGIAVGIRCQSPPPGRSGET